MNQENPFEIWRNRLALREKVVGKYERLNAIIQPSIAIPTRRRAKELKKSFRANARESQADSMLNMARPAGHKTLPRFPSERDRALFAAHMRRKEAGWVRG